MNHIFCLFIFQFHPKGPDVAKENAKAREVIKKDLAAIERVITLGIFCNKFSACLNLISSKFSA